MNVDQIEDFLDADRSIELVVFIYWLRTSLAPKTINPLLKNFSNGFYRKGIKVAPPGCKLLIYKAVMCQPEDAYPGLAEYIMETPPKYSTCRGNQDVLVLREMRKINSHTQ